MRRFRLATEPPRGWTRWTGVGGAGGAGGADGGGEKSKPRLMGEPWLGGGIDGGD